MKIAIVGTGISGLVCAHHLHRSHDVTVFEANDYVGGHSHTVEVSVEGTTHAVDTGFIVYNEANYPEFTRLLAELGVATQPTTMSFSVRDETTGLEYRADGLGGLFAQRANLVDPRFGRMLADVVRFNRRARVLLARHTSAVEAGDQADVARLENLTLDDLVAETRASPMFVSHYLVPLGAAIWSADPIRFGRFPAVSWSRFMDNHGLLHVRGTPHWRTVTGGLASLRRRPHRTLRPPDPPGHAGDQDPSAPPPRRPGRGGAAQLPRRSRAVRPRDPGQPQRPGPGPVERPERRRARHPGCVRPTSPTWPPCTPTPGSCPGGAAARACWNAHVGAPARARDGGPATSLTYWMNALGSIESARPLLVTLNRHDEIDPDAVLGRFDYDHPMFDLDALAAQRRRAEIQGVDGTWFAGAYWGYGFHEDGVQSGLDVCRAIETDTGVVEP